MGLLGILGGISCKHFQKEPHPATPPPEKPKVESKAPENPKAEAKAPDTVAKSEAKRPEMAEEVTPPPTTDEISRNVKGTPKALSFEKAYEALNQHTHSDERKEASPAINSNNIQMVFTSRYPEGYQNIFTKAIEGRSLTQKTFSSSREITPVFSPDGTKIAFASNRRGSWDIYMMNTKRGGNVRQLTRGAGDAIHPSFSPDGEQIVYERTLPDGQQYLETLKLDTNHTTILGPGKSPVWSPADPTNEENASNPFVNKILFMRQSEHPDGSSRSTIWMTNPHGDRVWEIFRSKRFLAFQPDWSSDARHVVFTAVDTKGLNKQRHTPEEAGDIWVVKSDGTHLYQLTENPAPEWAPFWASDGRIYFTMKRHGHQNIYSIEPLDFLGKEAPPVQPSGPSPGKNTARKDVKPKPAEKPPAEESPETNQEKQMEPEQDSSEEPENEKNNSDNEANENNNSENEDNEDQANN